MTSRTAIKLSEFHDFGSKLAQPSLVERLKEYVRWQRAKRDGQDYDESKLLSHAAPISINLDLTTACNYACDHCVDIDILNSPVKYAHDQLLKSLDNMAQRGLRSVILIGGGEPTVYPKFNEVVAFLKERQIQVSVVSNGSRTERLREIAHLLDENDWIRLSLDSGSDDTFQKMHKPRRPISLDQICEGIPKIREVNPNLRIGFSFIVVWQDAFNKDAKIIENIDEIVMAAERAKKYQFSYISYKPFLERAPENNAEVVGISAAHQEFDRMIQKMFAAIEEAKALNDDSFNVLESTNLRVLRQDSVDEFADQPKNCHMQFFRQVMSPYGMFNCPVYRHVDHAKVGDREIYAADDNGKAALDNTAELIDNFNATSECKKVTCLYNPANWWIEDLIENPGKLDDIELAAERNDVFF